MVAMGLFGFQALQGTGCSDLGSREQLRELNKDDRLVVELFISFSSVFYAKVAR
jgi:hypothetical protein